MVEIDGSLDEMRSSTDLEWSMRKRNLYFLLASLLIALLIGGSFIAFEIDSIILPITLILIVALPILMWHFPRFGMYLTFSGACLFEIFPTGYTDAITDRVPFWWNINTIFETYAHFNPKAAPINLFELILLLSGGMSLMRNVYMRTFRIKGGILLVPILIYIIFVVFGWMNGLFTGGDFKLSLQEVRAQFYFFIAYLIAVNQIKEERQTTTLLWISALTIGLKGALYTFRRYVTIAGQPLPDGGVGSHEEAFFLDIFALQLIVLWLCGIHPKLQRVMWLLLPLVVLGNLATNRRAGTAAIIIAIPFLLLAAFRGIPKRRKLTAALGLFIAIFGPLYYMTFKNSESSIAQPARAIKSNFDPDERDNLSNMYRIAENGCQMDTIQQSVFTIFLGYGYGKRMLHSRQIADISHVYEWWDLLPHNQILWVWMRTGSFGFLSFWFMISAIIIQCARIIRSDTANISVKMINIHAMTTIGMLMIFGLLDLQLSCLRDMLFAGYLAGAAMGTGDDQIR